MFEFFKKWFYPWLARFRSHRCPYCIEEFRLAETEFRCVNMDCKERARDKLRAEVWQDNAVLGKVLPPTGRFSRATSCQACGEQTSRRLCPHCHMELPEAIVDCPSRIFAVIGAKESGKTHYVATLVHELRKKIGPQLGLSLQPADDRSAKRYKAMEKTLFGDERGGGGETLGATRSGRQEADTRLPLVFTLTRMGTQSKGRRAVLAVTTLVFFDTAGEDLDAEDVMGKVNKYIGWAEGVIVLIDPLQLGAVRTKLGLRRTDPPAVNADTRDILRRTGQLISRVRKIPTGRTVPTVLAVAFSKFDAVENIMDGQSQYSATADHSSGFDNADAQALSDEVEGFLARWDGADLIDQSGPPFAETRFFAFTALGCQPQGTKIPLLLPHRVTEPMLWLLYKTGFLPKA